jgi:hypothetical protein
VTSDDLTLAQAQKLRDDLHPAANYLARLVTRMREQRFPPEDKLLLKVVKAYDAMLELSHELHAMSCNGMGRPPRQPK